MAITNMAGVQPRNELELTKRDLERLQQLGPMINLFEEEFAGPAIQRVMEIMRRRRMLLPMPASLRQVPLKINYISILKLAQQSAQQVSIKDALQLGGEISEASIAAKLPNPLRVLNLDKLYRNYCELADIDPDDMFTEQEVLQHDQARDRANQQAQMPQMGMAASAPAVVDGACALPAREHIIRIDLASSHKFELVEISERAIRLGSLAAIDASEISPPSCTRP